MERGTGVFVRRILFAVRPELEPDALRFSDGVIGIVEEFIVIVGNVIIDVNVINE